jgi:ATP-binding protein involved in chromosome partitioning
MLPQAEMLVVTTPARAAQKVATRVADMARRSYMKVVGVVENMSEFVAPDGSRHAVFGEGGGAALAAEIDAPLLGQVPLETEVATGNDEGEPVALHGTGGAATVFREIAARIAEEVAPPIHVDEIDMAGCSARLLGAVEAAFGSNA